MSWRVKAWTVELDGTDSVEGVVGHYPSTKVEVNERGVTFLPNPHYNALSFEQLDALAEAVKSFSAAVIAKNEAERQGQRAIAEEYVCACGKRFENAMQQVAHGRVTGHDIGR